MSVGQSEIFYLFVESQGNPEVDPVLFYIVGGPGCAALNGFFFQTGMLMVSSIYQGFYLGFLHSYLLTLELMSIIILGPLQFNGTDYTGGLPSLHLYPYTWTKVPKN